MALATRVCLLKSTVIGDVIYYKLDSDYGKYDQWDSYGSNINGVRGKRRMTEAEVFRVLMEMDNLSKSLNTLRFTEQGGVNNHS